MNLSRNYRSLAVCFVLGAASLAPLALRAQDDGTNGPPKVLVIQRGVHQAGQGRRTAREDRGGIHPRHGSRRRQAALCCHGLVVRVIEGSLLQRLSFLGRLGGGEQERGRDAALSAALDRANVADGDLLSETNSSVWIRRDDLSLNSGNLLGVRYMEIRQFYVRPGHSREWDELVKLVIAGYKGVPEMNWTTFEEQYGAGGHGFLVDYSAEVDGGCRPDDGRGQGHLPRRWARRD